MNARFPSLSLALFSKRAYVFICSPHSLRLDPFDDTCTIATRYPCITVVYGSVVRLVYSRRVRNTRHDVLSDWKLV